jgi:hypothetical protein
MSPADPSILLPLACGTLDVTDCFSTYQSNSSQYTSTAVNNAG